MHEFIDPPTAMPAALVKGQRLLGIDLGSKTLGLAISDTSLTIATPFQLMKRSKFSADADFLAELRLKEEIGALVFGMPYNMDGSEGPRAQATRAFIRNLRQHAAFHDLPIALWDERMSTMAVTRTLLEADTSRAKRAENVDKMAAAYILQGYLDRIWAD